MRLAMVVTAVLLAVGLVACSENDETPMAPSPVADVGGRETMEASGAASPGPGSTPANRTIGPVQPNVPPLPANWDVDIVEDHVRQARPPQHSGIRFSISPTRVVAGQAFTVTATVPTGVVASNRGGQGSRYNAWTMEWYRLGYGQFVAKGTCAGSDSDWKTCRFDEIPYVAGTTLGSTNSSACRDEDRTYEEYGMVLPPKCWDAKIILKTRRPNPSVVGSGAYWNNVLCIGVHHPTATEYERVRVRTSRCDQYIN